MVTFDQAYGYTHYCPLRKIERPVCPEEESQEVIKNYLHKLLIDTFDSANDDTALILKNMNFKRIKRGINSKTMMRRVQQILINYGIWKVKHIEGTTINKNIKSKSLTNNSLMEFNVDIARLKSENSRLQLIWFRYDFMYPDLDTFSKLIELANWNARAYELIVQKVPMQLTYFFPVLGSEYSFLYNPENGYENIAYLISKEAYFMKPSEYCDVCDACPMSWAGFKED